MAFEYLIEGREGAATALRLVHSGVMTGDWEAEYDALRKGNPLYLRTLGEYLKHFTGRAAVPVAAFGPAAVRPGPRVGGDHQRARGGQGRQGGRRGALHPRRRHIDGVVDTMLEPTFLGVRTDDALLRFVGGGGVILTGHHLFGDVDPAEAEKTWSEWLAAALA